MATTSYSAAMQYWYDNASGTLVDITAAVLNCNDVEIANVLQRVDPFGVPMAQHVPTGKGEMPEIEFSGLFQGNDGTIDNLFADRVPETPAAASRTFKIVWLTGRQTLFETHLKSYKRIPNNENGLTKYTVKLQPTGPVTEHGES